jgi:hypothetical protein
MLLGREYSMAYLRATKLTRWRCGMSAHIVLVGANILVVAGCCMQSSRSSEAVVATDVLIGPSGRAWSIDPPLSKKQREFDIRIELATSWELGPTCHTIRLDNEDVTIAAELRTVDGDVYSSRRIRQAVGTRRRELIFTFSEDLPRSVEFDQVAIIPSSSVACRRIISLDWSPK